MLLYFEYMRGIPQGLLRERGHLEIILGLSRNCIGIIEGVGFSAIHYRKKGVLISRNGYSKADFRR